MTEEHVDDTERWALMAYNFTDLLKIAGFASQPMLRENRRQPAPDQKPVGQYWSGHAWVVLYKAGDAVDMPPLSPGRQRQYDKARTCAMCGATRKTTFPKGRDGERYCAKCEKPAAELLWQHEREADRPAVVEWARGVLADPTVVFGVRRYQQWWWENLVVDLDGTVLLDANVRHNVREPDESHPQFAELSRISPLAIMDQVEALRGRRLISWDTDTAPALVTSFDESGWAVAHAAEVARVDAFGRWYDRWVGELREHGSYLHNPQLKQHWMPRDPAECIAKMREALVEMASGAGCADRGGDRPAASRPGAVVVTAAVPTPPAAGLVECDVCGRELTDPVSRARGRGRTCKANLDRAPMLPGLVETVVVSGGML